MPDVMDGMAKLEQMAHRSASEDKADKIMQTAKTKLVLSRDASSCFFASLAMRLDFKPDWEVPTAATDGKRLLYNPDFVIGLPIGQVVGMLAHEAMHCANKHFARRGSRDPENFNIAADLSINPLLVDAGFQLPDGGMMPGTGEYTDFNRGLSMEEYYSLLGQKKPDEDGEPDDSPGACDPGGCGSVMPREGMSEADMNQLDQEWTANVAAAQQAAERRGDMPGSLKRLCGEVLAPNVDWKATLREFVTRPAKRDYNWKRPNRRFAAQGLFLPSLNSLEIGHIVALIDVSGSIDDETLRRFGSELQDVAGVGLCKMTIVYHDSQVCRVDEWNRDDGPLVLEACGGGGTDHRPAFEWIDENCEEKPDVVVCLTDLQSRFPSEQPEYPVMWASTDKQQGHPWGERLDIPIE